MAGTSVRVPTTHRIERVDSAYRVAPNDHDSGQIDTLRDSSILNAYRRKRCVQKH